MVTRIQDHTDFASAAMMRLVAAGLKREGMAIPVRSPSGARVPRSAKRDVLQAAMAAHGAIAILRIADVARDMPREPVLQALLKAGDIGDLLDRWQRLERFSHGRHEVRCQRIGEHAFRLTHGARDKGAAPGTAETLLVMGVLAVLAEVVSGAPVTLGPANGAPWRRAGCWQKVQGDIRDDELILKGASSNCSKALDPVAVDKDLVAEMRCRIASDPLRRWTLAELAAAAGTSDRTLQRRLRERSASFSRLLAEARLEIAAHYLCDRTGPGLAEIGFLSGYSDQAHFTRSFTKGVGTTPSAYRADFAA